MVTFHAHLQLPLSFQAPSPHSSIGGEFKRMKKVYNLVTHWLHNNPFTAH